MTFIIEKDPGLIPQILSRMLDSRVNGVTLVDPDLEDTPLIYANKTFENVTGYTQREIMRRHCRFLQGANLEQRESLPLRQAIYNCQPVELTIKNYRKKW
ncbi:MAG: PAS domain-containing protein [Nitrosospira sp.]